jgi:hypothetical protein
MIAINWNSVRRLAAMLGLFGTVGALVVTSLLGPGAAESASAGEGNESFGFLPFYARTGVNDQILNEDWAVVYFYYEDAPGCVPDDFNLMNLFDPAAPSNCDVAATNGKSVPNPDGRPKHTSINGNGNVPVWFVPRAEFDTAIADGQLFIDELTAIALKGTASQFHETLNPAPWAQQVHIASNGRGELEDGRTFNFSLSATVFGKTGGAYQVNVRIR